MKLPPDTVIAPEKIFRYLLVPQAKGDKSAFLALAGYNLSNASLLIDDIHNHILHGDASLVDSTAHGEYYEIRSSLTGPNGETLMVRTIWMKELLSGLTKFITLIPERKYRP